MASSRTSVAPERGDGQPAGHAAETACHVSLARSKRHRSPRSVPGRVPPNSHSWSRPASMTIECPPREVGRGPGLSNRVHVPLSSESDQRSSKYEPLVPPKARTRRRASSITTWLARRAAGPTPHDVALQSVSHAPVAGSNARTPGSWVTPFHPPNTMSRWPVGSQVAAQLRNGGGASGLAGAAASSHAGRARLPPPRSRAHRSPWCVVPSSARPPKAYSVPLSASTAPQGAKRRSGHGMSGPAVAGGRACRGARRGRGDDADGEHGEEHGDEPAREGGHRRFCPVRGRSAAPEPSCGGSTPDAWRRFAEPVEICDPGPALR